MDAKEYLVKELDHEAIDISSTLLLYGVNIADIMEEYHQLKSQEEARECKWKYDDDHDKYDTDCGRAFSFMVDTPKENDYLFCPGCGKRIKEEDEG